MGLGMGVGRVFGWQRECFVVEPRRTREFARAREWKMGSAVGELLGRGALRISRLRRFVQLPGSCGGNGEVVFAAAILRLRVRQPDDGEVRAEKLGRTTGGGHAREGWRIPLGTRHPLARGRGGGQRIGKVAFSVPVGEFSVALLG